MARAEVVRTDISSATPVATSTATRFPLTEAPRLYGTGPYFGRVICTPDIGRLLHDFKYTLQTHHIIVRCTAFTKTLRKYEDGTLSQLLIASLHPLISMS